jgi:CcmD family protein
MDSRNFLFLFYGLAAAWAILAAYVAFHGARENSLKRQIETLKRMVQDREDKRG